MKGTDGSRVRITVWNALLGGLAGLLAGGVVADRSHGGPPDMTIEVLMASVIGAGIGWLVGALVGWIRSRGAHHTSRAEAWWLRAAAVAFLILGLLVIGEISRTSFGPQIDDVGRHDPRRASLGAAVGSDTALAIVTLLTLSLRRTPDRFAS